MSKGEGPSEVKGGAFRKWFFRIAGTFVFIVLGAGIVASWFDKTPTPSPPPPPTPLRYVTTDTEGVINDSDMRWVVQARANNDYAALNAMLEDHRAYELPRGTRVTIEETFLTYDKMKFVTIQSGAAIGTQLFVLADDLSRDRQD